MSGAHDRNRTGDLVLTKDVLYRLSYVGRLVKNLAGPIRQPCSQPAGRLERVMGIEPTQSAWKAEVLPLNYTRSAHQPVANNRSGQPAILIENSLHAAGRLIRSMFATTPRLSATLSVLVEGEGFEPSKA